MEYERDPKRSVIPAGLITTVYHRGESIHIVGSKKRAHWNGRAYKLLAEAKAAIDEALLAGRDGYRDAPGSSIRAAHGGIPGTGKRR
jgi:hypothetical protein